MKLLLDTHVWVWAEESDENLGKKTKSLLLDQSNKLFVTTFSSLELAQLHFKRRLIFRRPLSTWINASMAALQLNTITLSHATALAAYSLPDSLHNDPADRVLIATALELGAVLLTADQNLLDYKHIRTYNARH